MAPSPIGMSERCRALDGRPSGRDNARRDEQARRHVAHALDRGEPAIFVTAIDAARAWCARRHQRRRRSFGGIETLLTAERPMPGLRAALDFAGASMAWNDSPLLRERLLRAVESARVRSSCRRRTTSTPRRARSCRPRCAPRSCRNGCASSPNSATARPWPATPVSACSLGSWGPDVLDFLRHRR